MAATDTAERLRNSVQGQVIGPEDEDYDEARAIWNGAIDRRPAWIARCTGVADVAAAVRFARERDLLVAVRSGGHGVGGHAVCDGGLVIDLSPMKGIRVDPVRRTARAEAGVLWGELDRETQLFGLATVGGIVSHTGIGGSDTRRRDRLADAKARRHGRQPRLRGPGDRPGRDRHCKRG